ncbi:MAG TPA: DUF3301 domain-containing protein [Rhodanobacteraceae bacterium]
MLSIWLPILCIAAAAAAWYHVLRLREYAVAQARRVCERHGLQLLDDSVALHRMHLNRHRGGWYVTREYRFDTSLGGNDRRAASITLWGQRVVSAQVPESAPAGVTVAVPSHACMPTLPRPATGDRDNVVAIDRARRSLH